jgi:hypothetical protein
LITRSDPSITHDHDSITRGDPRDIVAHGADTKSEPPRSLPDIGENLVRVDAGLSEVDCA